MEMKKSEEILTNYWDGSLPVNPVSIANKLGITIYKSSLGEKTSISNNNKEEKSITVNCDMDIVKQRFAITHALSHFVLSKELNFEDKA